MPLIDYDLHPMALAFGIFCAFVALAYLSAVVYLTFGSSSETKTAQREAFVPDDAAPSLDALKDDAASPPRRSDASRDSSVGNGRPKTIA
jgi:hypothetical protein